MKRLIHMSGNSGQGRPRSVAKPHDPVVIHTRGAHERARRLRHVDGLVGSNAHDGSIGLMC